MSEERKIFDSEEGKNQLLHALINQLEADFEDQEYYPMDEFITKLMENPENHNIIWNYLGDSAQENFIENKTFKRFN